MTTTRRRLALAWMTAVLVAGAGCARGADEATLEADLRAKLDRGLSPGLFEVAALRRAGSGPLPAAESGAERVIVYYNVTLQLARDYAFGAPDHLGPSSVAYALGATEKGIFGLQANSQAGDQVHAYGSAVYERSGDGWAAVAGAPPEAVAVAPDLRETGPSLRSKQLIDQLAEMVNLPPPGVPPQDDAIIADELARASENIERRVRRREHTFTLATGPEGGEYARFGQALVGGVNAAAPHVTLRQRTSAGSVENAFLLDRGEADYAIMQADVAAAAVAGDDVFARGAPLDKLRAVGGLFPEAVHVVVLADSPIQDITGLRGRRVAIGAPTSGTRFDAIAVLEAHGLTPADLAAARDDDLGEAIAQLTRKRIDAFFVTTLAPARPLQRLAAGRGFRLLPIRGAALERIAARRPGLAPMTLPANTYPRQSQAVLTVASSALLVTTADAPDVEVARVANLVFAPGAGILLAPGNEHRGVTIPLHPGTLSRRDE